METLLQDLRYGIRTLLRKPAFTAVAVLALTLGIGANTAIFSVVNAVLLRPLPYKDADRLVMVWGNLFRPGLEQMAASGAEFVDYKEQSQVFDEIAVYGWEGHNFTGGDLPERVA